MGSKLKYGVLIWSPLYNHLESVQIGFLKFICYKLDGVYPERGISEINLLTRFLLNSLLVRRLTQSITFLFKLLHNKIDCIHIISKIWYSVPRINARYKTCFYLDTCRTNALARSPIFVMSNTFNGISHLCDINFDNFINVIKQKNFKKASKKR